MKTKSPALVKKILENFSSETNTSPNCMTVIYSDGVNVCTTSLTKGDVQEFLKADMQQLMVEEFMRPAQQELPAHPIIPKQEIVNLRVDLIYEEFMVELVEALDNHDIVKVADALGDIDYVVKGAASAFGIRLGPIFNEIHRSNMTKFIDGTFRADGKYVKGPNYSPADLKSIIEQQLKKP